jgi:hypothetical protein
LAVAGSTGNHEQINNQEYRMDDAIKKAMSYGVKTVAVKQGLADFIAHWASTPENAILGSDYGGNTMLSRLLQSAWDNPAAAEIEAKMRKDLHILQAQSFSLEWDEKPIGQQVLVIKGFEEDMQIHVPPTN